MTTPKYPGFVETYCKFTGKGKSAAFATLRHGATNGLFDSGAVFLIKSRPDAKRGRYLCDPEKLSAWIESCAVKGAA